MARHNIAIFMGVIEAIGIIGRAILLQYSSSGIIYGLIEAKTTINN